MDRKLTYHKKNSFNWKINKSKSDGSPLWIILRPTLAHNALKPYTNSHENTYTYLPRVTYYPVQVCIWKLWLPENGVIGFSVKRFGGFGCMLCRTLKLMIAYIQIYSFTRHRDVQKKKDGALLQQCPPNDRSVTYKIIQNYEIKTSNSRIRSKKYG